MKVILLADIPKFGRRLEVKDVKPGYAKNYLFPRGYAKVLTSSALLELEKQSQAQKLAAEKELVQAEALAAKLEGLEVEVPVKMSVGGKGYAAVSASQIADILKKLGFNVAKNQIVITEPIKKTGEYQVAVSLPHGLESQIKIVVVEEGQEVIE
ncbi:MAG: 50S ribosomal protein L9 [Parcubacteria group bacterium]|nr:50S ribosomal protein L9 [Parcubacteria group bacterium]